MTRFVTCILLFSLVAFGANAQKKKKKLEEDTTQSSFLLQPNRIEFEIGDKDEDFRIISAGEKGLLMIKQTRVRGEKGYIWELNLIDSVLNVVWIRPIVVPYGASYLGFDYNMGNFYMLFGKAQYKLEEMQVMQISLANGLVSNYEISTVFPIQLTEFEVLGNTLIFGGYAQYRPVVMLYDMFRDQPRVLPGFYNTKSEIISIRTEDESRTFAVVLSEKTIKKKVTISLKTFTEAGDVLQTKALDTDEGKTLLDGISTEFDEGIQYIAGTYARQKSEYSRGLYLAKLQNGDQQFINYHNYADLENFFSYMRAKREQRVKDRIERKKIKGKKVKFNYRLLIHDIVERKDEYILIGEAYFPKYSSYGSHSYGSTYDFTASNFVDPNFIGYRYTHAVVVGFDKKGNIIWDNSFEINDVLSLSLKENVQVSVEEDRIVLLYVYENVIRSKIVQKHEILEGKTFDPIELQFKADEIRDNNKDMEGLEKWFDGSFYAYGIQHIKNLTDNDVKLNRRVFYINKVQYK